MFLPYSVSVACAVRNIQVLAYSTTLLVALVAGFTGNSRYVGTALSFLSAVLMSFFLYIPQSLRTNAGMFPGANLGLGRLGSCLGR